MAKKNRAQTGSAHARSHYFPISPDELRTDLTNARIAGTRDIAEVLVADVSARIVKLRMVEDIEEFASNLEMHRFVEGNYFRYS